MPIVKLPEECVFPNPALASDEGLLAYGGDLSSNRLLAAYRSGIFPWFDDCSPDIMWWSPNPRMVLYAENFKLSKSLKKRIVRKEFDVRIDTSFEEVIKACSLAPRYGQDGTWLTDEMQDAYIELHKLGFAHSVECWQDDKLVGGLYGVSLGKLFFGESMFHHVTDASKVAFYSLNEISKKLNFSFIDCQMHTDHLESLGAKEISRQIYLNQLEISNQQETTIGKWTALL